MILIKIVANDMQSATTWRREWDTPVCGPGQVAALECPRHSIHCRSPSNPLMQKRNPPPDGEGFILAEKEGFEPSIPFWGIHDFQSCALGRTTRLLHAGRIEGTYSIQAILLYATPNAKSRKIAKNPKNSQKFP